jgi:hypothetical protein
LLEVFEPGFHRKGMDSFLFSILDRIYRIYFFFLTSQMEVRKLNPPYGGTK